VLDPAGARQDLLVLELVAGHLGAIVIEDHAAGTGGALIDGGYEFRELGQLVSSGVNCATSFHRP
jgi:hypothetical protein